MHILLTDVVTCPRCGPEFGLIVLADRLEARRVIEGSLGCANCREEYPVRGGIADLRWRGPDADDGSAGEPVAEEVEPDPEKAYRIAALLGVTSSPAPVVVVSSDAALVSEVQGHLSEVGVLGVSRELPSGEVRAEMGWLLSSGALPFRTRSLAGIALTTGDPAIPIPDALRCLTRGARVVVDPTPPGVVDELLEEGAEILLQQEQVAVAYDPRAG